MRTGSLGAELVAFRTTSCFTAAGTSCADEGGSARGSERFAAVSFVLEVRFRSLFTGSEMRRSASTRAASSSVTVIIKLRSNTRTWRCDCVPRWAISKGIFALHGSARKSSKSEGRVRTQPTPFASTARSTCPLARSNVPGKRTCAMTCVAGKSTGRKSANCSSTRAKCIALRSKAHAWGSRAHPLKIQCIARVQAGPRWPFPCRAFLPEPHGDPRPRRPFAQAARAPIRSPCGTRVRHRD